ncbi:MAG: NAD(P)/FAD-dependent oxidoreductase [Planctomycetia bacterium]|nr:NAD(P)/FAD-dependent oxidoreductase [Planctomycetia bacterium]
MTHDEYDVAIVGAGAAGLLAAARAAERGRRTILLEKNTRPGVKILMSGGTRCNLTHACDARGIVDAFGEQGPFLHSALAALGPRDLVSLVEAEGVPTKVEPTGKIFPVSNKATDILAAFLRRLERSGCTLAAGEAVTAIDRHEERFRITTASRTLLVESVAITTGGCSYPGSGTTGDGYSWAAQFGHMIIPARPALVPVTTNADWVRDLKGITIPDVAVTVEPRVASAEPPRASRKARPLASRRGSLLFAHFGLSGPVALDVSRVISGHARPQDLDLVCDFLPSTAEPQLEELFRDGALSAGGKLVTALMPDALPRRLVSALLTLAEIPELQRCAELGKNGRSRLVRMIKHCAIPVSGTMGFKKAEVTAGGISLVEVDSRTMESKLVRGLYLAGEVLDLDGPIGGYNFQAAFSTGWLAGENL